MLIKSVFPNFGSFRSRNNPGTVYLEIVTVNLAVFWYLDLSILEYSILEYVDMTDSLDCRLSFL